MGNAITAAGNNNLFGFLGVQDALMHMFPDVHAAIGERMHLQDVVMPGKLELNVIIANPNDYHSLTYFSSTILNLLKVEDILCSSI